MGHLAIPNFDALQVLAEIAMGLAGFSAILVGLSGNVGKMEPPEKFRILALIYGSLGAVILALLPFAIFTNEANQNSAWTVVGTVLLVFTLAGFSVLPRTSWNLRKTYPEIFPLPLILSQSAIHVTTSLFALIIVLNLSEYRANLYTGAILLLIVHASVSFIRTLFFRRSELGGE